MHDCADAACWLLLLVSTSDYTGPKRRDELAKCGARGGKEFAIQELGLLVSAPIVCMWTSLVARVCFLSGLAFSRAKVNVRTPACAADLASAAAWFLFARLAVLRCVESDRSPSLLSLWRVAHSLAAFPNRWSTN